MPPPALNQPLDLHKPLTELVSQLDGLNIVITGAASGLGREMVRLWAKGGANILIGDLNLQGAETVADELRSKHAKSKDQVFETIKVDVTSHASQLAMFRKALTSLPGGRIDIVVANAGVGEVGAKTAFGGEQSGSGKTADPPALNTATLDIDITGVAITTHLAYWAFSQPISKPSPLPQDTRSILLLGSMASLTATPDTPLYGAAKHAVLGLYRALRQKSLFGSNERNVVRVGSGESKMDGPKAGSNGKAASSNSSPKTTSTARVHVHFLGPYYTDTPILRSPDDGARHLPMDTELTRIEDVVEGATRLVTAKEGGHALCVTTERWAKGRGKGGIWEMREVRAKL